MTPGEKRYADARSGTVDIAFQVVGSGGRDVVVGTGSVWELPETVHFLKRLPGLGWLFLYGARGTGMSDLPVSSFR